MNKFIKGMKFNRLTIIGRGGSHKDGSILWKCQCDCGNIHFVVSTHLKNGSIKSCGCLVKETAAKLKTTHGMSNSITYNSWRGLLKRCDPNNKEYSFRYSNNGIFVCKEWHTFEGFIKDMGERPSKYYTIDRINNNKGYFKGNCRWATAKEQCNNKSNNRMLEFRGIKKTLSQWSDDLKIPSSTITNRIKRGFSVEQALSVRYLDNSIRYIHNGSPKTIAELSKEFRISYDTIKYRLDRGCTINEALVKKKYEFKNKS